MKMINPDDRQLDQSKSVGNLKIWRKPILIHMDIKQTQALGSGCPPHQHKEGEICVDN